MVQIPVSESVARVIAQRVSERSLSSPSDYIQELVEADATRVNRRRIDKALLEALTDDPTSDLEWNEATKAAWRRETQTCLEAGKLRIGTP
jgi:Arc/MetJ-type ribon-helix-helix transcriptional regulator